MAKIGERLFDIPSQHMANWGDALISKNPPWKTTPEYHQWASKDLTQQKSKELSQIPYVGNLAAGAFELAAPFMALGASPIYDIPQAFHKYSEEPGKYEVNNKWDKINAYFPNLEGTSVSGILNAIDMENPLSAAWNRFLGAGQPLYNRLMNRPQTLYDVQKRNNLRTLNMNRRKQIMQQNIKQAEAAAAIRPTNVPGTPIVPTGGGTTGGISNINIQKQAIGMPEHLTYTPPPKPKPYVSPARPHGNGGGGGGGQKGSMPTGTAGRNPWGRADGGLINFYRHGGFSG
jgi:hypothetical protein